MALPKPDRQRSILRITIASDISMSCLRPGKDPMMIACTCGAIKPINNIIIINFFIFLPQIKMSKTAASWQNLLNLRNACHALLSNALSVDMQGGEFRECQLMSLWIRNSN